MNFKNRVLGFVTSLLIVFSSCQKDLVSPESQALSSEMVSSDATAADNVPETASPVVTPITTKVNANCLGYLEILPARYFLTTKSYPLILFIHGIGELGTGVGRLTCCGLPYYANKKLFPAEFQVNGQRFSYVVMAPQFLHRPSASDVQNTIDYAVKKYRVDPTRIYIAGLSMGGGSTWDYSAVYGQNVAAAVPVCGGTAPTATLAANIASKNLPVWTISSKNDKVVPLSWATNWVNWIKADNPANAANIKFTVYTTEDHNSTWAKGFNPATKVDGVNVYEWMLKYRRTGGGISAPAAPPTTQPSSPPVTIPPATVNKPTAMAGADAIIHLFWNFNPLLNGTLSTIPGGWFVSTTWTKIAGPASYKIISPSAAETRVSGLTEGTYTFRLTVKTNTGASATDDVNITVLP